MDSGVREDINVSVEQWTNDLADAFKKEHEEVLGSDEITSSMFAEIANCKAINGARNFLDKQVRAGKMTKRKSVQNGRLCSVYKWIRK